MSVTHCHCRHPSLLHEHRYDGQPLVFASERRVAAALLSMAQEETQDDEERESSANSHLQVGPHGDHANSDATSSKTGDNTVKEPSLHCFVSWRMRHIGFCGSRAIL